MEINITKGYLPSREQLVDILNNEFHNKGYSTKLFGWGYGKSVMISKSAFTGVRIQIEGTKIKVNGTTSSLLVLTLLGWLTFLFNSSQKQMENEVYQFLKHKYQ